MSDPQDSISVVINGKRSRVAPGTIVASAVLADGVDRFRRSVSGQPRGPLCGMGVCMECRVTVNGVAGQRSCQLLCSEGMEIATDA